MEKDVERALIAAVRKSGGLCLKLISPGWSGAPDRLCLFPGGQLCFVELKTPGGKLRPLQVRRVDQLRALGFPVTMIDSLAGARAFGRLYLEEDHSSSPHSCGRFSSHSHGGDADAE